VFCHNVYMSMVESPTTDGIGRERGGGGDDAMAQTQDNTRLDAAIRSTLKMFKESSPHQVWTWAMNREGDLIAIEERMRALVAAGTLSYVPNSAPVAYRLGRKR